VVESAERSEPVRLLVVCHANVSRSPAAVALLRGARDERGVEIELASAGTHAPLGQPVSARTRLALRAVLGEDLELDAHRSRLFGAEDLAWADLVLTMEAGQVRLIRRSHPDAAGRTATIAALASGLPADRRPLVDRVSAMALASLPLDPSGDVDDPAGGGDADYERSMAALVVQCRALARRLLG